MSCLAGGDGILDLFLIFSDPDAGGVGGNARFGGGDGSGGVWLSSCGISGVKTLEGSVILVRLRRIDDGLGIEAERGRGV